MLHLQHSSTWCLSVFARCHNKSCNNSPQHDKIQTLSKSTTMTSIYKQPTDIEYII